jgi:hypothetical protein
MKNKKKEKDTRSWFAGICKKCGFNVVVTQPNIKKHPMSDYFWYCSNKGCEKHLEGEHTADTEVPLWVDY